MSRILQINQQIKQALGQIISAELEFPEIMVTITRVETSPDLKSAKVFISIIPDNLRGTALKILRKNLKMLQSQLKRNMTAKFTPNIKFLIDEQEIHASQIDKLLDEIS